ncbi:MAG: acetylornithine deacetylase [Chitinophagales bacterium]|nr:MAG: acetylornithine deacetylase [Chitinophagales bacterium]
MPEPGLLYKKEAITELYQAAVSLLKELIALPSFSREEEKTADAIESFLHKRGVLTFRRKNNVWARNKHFHPGRPTLLLNSHHDTVQPNAGYTLDPFQPIERDGKLFGLGSNDAGGALVALMAAFLYFHEKENLRYNLVFAATAEEEISGSNGVELILPELGKIDFAIVGEPTQMQMAIAEKGLMVLDCVVHGKAGHAAREEGVNAIYLAMRDIEWFRSFRFPKVSPLLGEVKMSVTIIRAGTQHNVVPDTCTFTVDVRTNELYSNEEALQIIREQVSCEVKPRSLRLKSSSIPKDHPIVKAGLKWGRSAYGSPTTSDQALMPFPSLKIGPGDSARSHSADEFIFLQEIEEGIELYVKMLNEILLP